MKICSDIALEKWTPNFSSSGLVSPTWTRARSEKVELFNSLEWVAWTDNPVQVVLCDACGHVGCAVGGYVHVSRLGNFVLWSRPQVDAEETLEVAQYEAAWPLKRFGAIAIPKNAWEEWRTVASVPQIDALTPANGRAIFDAWFLAPARSRRVDEIVPMLKEGLLGTDSLELSDAIERVARWIERLKDSSACFANASLRSPTAIGARIETLYFDGPADEDWPAFAISDGVDYLLLDRDHALVTSGQDA
jgi:hypothetical protein